MPTSARLVPSPLGAKLMESTLPIRIPFMVTGFPTLSPSTLWNCATYVAVLPGSYVAREAIDVPAGSQTAFTILGIAATSHDNAYLLAQTSSVTGDGVSLFRRTVNGATVTWEPVDLGPAAGVFAHDSTPADGISGVAGLGGRAQPLTVTLDGLWIDGTLQDPDGPADFTLYADATTGQVQASWCDARTSGGEALCDHPLGFRFSRRAGYRSFGFTGDGEGSRIVTNPLQAGGDDDTNLGSYMRFDGSQVRRMPGGGGNAQPSGAFSSADHGWLEGLVQVGAGEAPRRFDPWPVAVRAPFTAIATEPGKTPGAADAPALAVGADGAVARYTPGAGWGREFLLTSTGAVSSPTLRGVAWPEAGRAYAVGDLGAMWLWRAETGLWEKDGAMPIGFDGVHSSASNSSCSHSRARSLVRSAMSSACTRNSYSRSALKATVTVYMRVSSLFFGRAPDRVGGAADAAFFCGRVPESSNRLLSSGGSPLTLAP